MPDVPAGDGTSLGSYSDVAIPPSGDITATPSEPPAGITKLFVRTSTSFNGEITADPAFGVVRITNAHPANIIPASYPVEVRGFGPGGTVSRTFQLTVTSGAACPGISRFTSAPDVGVGAFSRDISIADFNNDGIQDLAVVNKNSNNVSIRLGNGTGGFTLPATPEVTVGQNVIGIAVADINGDGNNDMATTSFDLLSVSIRLGDGTGGFSGPAAAEIPIGIGRLSAVRLADLNDDGYPDLLAGGEDSLAIRLGDGGGGFSIPRLLQWV